MKPNKPTQRICTKHPKAWGCVRGKDHDGACSNIPPQPTVGEQADEEFVRSNYAITSSTAGEYGKYRRWSVTVTISDTQLNGNGSTKSEAWADLRRHLSTPIPVGEHGP